MFQLADTLDSALSQVPSPVAEISRHELDDLLVRRVRPFLSHSAVETYDVREPLRKYFPLLPAVILNVEHDEERQRHFPQPVMEQAPYPFECTRQQVLDLAQDIRRVLGSTDDQERK